MMKKGKKSGAIVCVILAVVLISSLFAVRQFKGDNSKTKEEKKKTEKEDDGTTYSTEYVKSMDSIAKDILSKLDPDETYASRVYGKDMTVNDWMTIDDKNAYDKCTGKYKKEDDKKSDKTENKIKEKNDQQVITDMVNSLKENEKKGILTKAKKDVDGVYVLSSKKALKKMKKKLQPYDVAYCLNNDAGSVSTYVNMLDFSKKDEKIAINAMKKKNKVLIEKSISATIDNDQSTMSPIFESAIEFDNKLKTISLPKNSEDITNSCGSYSKKDCFDFLSTYMQHEGVDLSLTDSTPVYDWVYDRRYRFNNEQEMTKTIMSKLSSYNIESKGFIFDFNYDSNIKCIHNISNEYYWKIDDKPVILYVTYQVTFY